MGVYKWIWQYIREYKFRMLTGFLLVIVTSLLVMVNPYIQGIIVDKVIYEGRTDLLMRLIALMIGVTLIRTVIRYAFQCNFEFVSQDITFRIRKNIYSRLQELDFGFFDKNKTGDIMARMTGDLDAVRHFTAFVIYSIFENTMIFVSVTIVLFTVNFKFVLILLSLTPLIAFLTYKMAGSVRPAFSSIREQFSRLNSVVQENISGNRVVKAFAKEDYEIEKFMKQNDAFREKNIEASKIWGKYLPVLDIIASSLYIIVILVGGIMVITGSLTLGELVMFNGLIWALSGPMRMAGWLINDVQRYAASAVKIIALLETEPKIKNSECSVQRDRVRGQVEFRNVSFSYGDEKVLENISFKANPGQTVAIIGPTGSGKSTLVSLICRFYDCTSGEVLIDGINVKDWDIKKLRSNIASAMQDIFLFSDTIEGNIAYGVPDASMEQVKWAAGVAGAHEFITSFPEGYDTIIGERGVGLSGGQKQRIALARALLKNPSILILDDTTSSVDMETEHEIHRTLKSYYKDKTTFIIAHRISSVKNADMILVLENGKIIERGRHEELLAQRGYYYSVFINQFGDFDNSYAREVV